WAPYSQFRVNGFERFRGVVVEFEVSGLFRFPGPEIDVRFVPDLEIPLRNFVNAVTLDEVSGEGANEGVPLGIVLGRRNDLLVPERMHVLTEREFLRHETDFDKGADAAGEQTVVDLVDVGKVVDGGALGVFVVDADFVVEDGVE